MLYGSTLGNGEFTFIAGTISYLLEQCVYSVIDHSSLSDCTMQCVLDEYNNCSRFVFESDTQRCMLQSDYISSDVPTTTITATQAMMFFEAHVDCISGYDYDRTTKLCIKEYPDRMTWLDARARCQQDGGDLISIPSLEKWRFVANYLADCGRVCYSCTGMAENDSCHNVATCQDDEVCFTQKYQTEDNKTRFDVGCSYPELLRYVACIVVELIWLTNVTPPLVARMTKDSMNDDEPAGKANGTPFTTKDRSNNIGQCNENYHGGWWYVNCEYSDLNRQYGVKMANQIIWIGVMI
ncbi:unnamed protein product [Mytilus edulis]|uniref:Apple domain-containing protein n=1 Tax=Mytilus edulis TaxID=6550 RepID=A0A8S3SGS7_MYTED|nr:unnamed protein product [Mytilus edulis]